MPRLSENQRAEAIGMLRAGMAQQAVANQFRCSRITIHRLNVRYQANGSVQDRPRSGRPRVLTPRQDAHIRTLQLRSRFTPAAAIARQTRGLHG